MKYYVKGKKEKYLVKKNGVIGKVTNIGMATSFGSETKARKCLEEGRKQGLGLKNWKVEGIDPSRPTEHAFVYDSEGGVKKQRYVICDGTRFIGHNEKGKLVLDARRSRISIYQSEKDAAAGLRILGTLFPGSSGYRYMKFEEAPLHIPVERDKEIMEAQKAQKTVLDTPSHAEGKPETCTKEARRGTKSIKVITKEHTADGTDDILYSFIGRLECRRDELVKLNNINNRKLVDGYHFVEFSDFGEDDHKEVYAAYSMMREYLRRRRKIKDEFDKIEKLAPLKKQVCNNIHLFSVTKKKTYRPRCMDELFLRLSETPECHVNIPPVRGIQNILSTISDAVRNHRTD